MSEEFEKAGETAKDNGAVTGMLLSSGKYAYFRKPNRYAMGQYFVQKEKNLAQAMEGLLAACLMPEYSTWKASDMNDEDFFQLFEIGPILIDSVEKKTSTLVRF